MEQTSTLEQRVLALALEPCPANFRTPDNKDYCIEAGHDDCNGTGARFPMLRRLCPHILAVQGFISEIGIALALNDNHLESCRGYLPVTTTDALLEAGKPWHIGIWWDTTGYSARYTHPAMSRPDMLRNVGSTPLEALVAALEAALEIKA